MSDARPDIRFKGWDWTELLRVWPESRNVKWPKDTKENPFAKEEAQAKWLTAHVTRLAFDDPSWELRQVRSFAKKCATVSKHTSQSIMQAVADSPCDYAFLSWFGSDLTRWWT